jgi:cell division protein FtsN
MKHPEEEKSPILKSWRNVYALVIGVLITVIISLYFFTQHYK